MPEWKKRVSQECADLRTKLGLLSAYIKNGCPQASPEQSMLLVIQQQAMETYAAVLEARLSLD